MLRWMTTFILPEFKSPMHSLMPSPFNGVDFMAIGTTESCPEIGVSYLSYFCKDPKVLFEWNNRSINHQRTLLVIRTALDSTLFS